MVEKSTQNMSPHPSHTSFPIIAVAIIGIFATIFLLVFYYIFVIKCCLNWSRIRRFFSLSMNRNHDYSVTLPEFKGLNESVIRSIPTFRFQIPKDSENGNVECAVCLAEFLQDEKLRMIPNCAHVFHIDCIDVWLQNNENCPLCRNSISMSINPHFSIRDNPLCIPPSPLNEQDYVVIELGNDNDNKLDDHTTNSSQSMNTKTAKKIGKKHGHVASMGDECIDVTTRRKGDDLFSYQPIRRSFSMDSASDQQLYLAIQEIIQKKKNEVCDVSTSSSKRPFFSIGHARSAILPHQIKPQL